MSPPRPMYAKLEPVTTGVQIELRYAVRGSEDDWAIPEDWPVPQSIAHGAAEDHLASVLRQWAKGAGRPLFVAKELAIRWLEEKPQIGIDPDVSLLDPPPPNVLGVRSLCLWKAGHVAPPLSFEIVSESHPYKDYAQVHERYAAFGARELVVFDPLLVGPRSLGGPFAIQVWRRNDAQIFERDYAGPGPVFSEVLGAWLLVDEQLPQVADDRAGLRRWPTEQDYERAEKERERAEKEHERAEKERERAEKEHERAEKERERAARLEVERRLAALEQAIGKGESER